MLKVSNNICIFHLRLPVSNRVVNVEVQLANVHISLPHCRNVTLKEIVRLQLFDKKQFKLASDELLIELKENIVNQIESSKDNPDLVFWSISVYNSFMEI